MSGAFDALPPLHRLKLVLYAEGLEVPEETRRLLAAQWGDRRLSLADYASTSGITLDLGSGVWVNSPIADHNSNFVVRPSASLVPNGQGGFAVAWKGEHYTVTPIPLPAYRDQKNAWGEPCTAYAYTHADRVRVSPIEGCAYTCTFCDLPYRQTYGRRPAERMIDAIARALNDPMLPARHALVSGGVPRDDDFAWQRDTYIEIAQAFPALEIDVMMVPAADLLDLEALRAAGIHGLSINMEVFNTQVARKLAPRKHRLGQDRYLDFIERAVEVFGPGRVRSLLLVGLEDTADTLAGVKALAERGCDPVLGPFRPDEATPLRDRPAASIDQMAACLVGAWEIISHHPPVALGPRCLPCRHNALG